MPKASLRMTEFILLFSLTTALTAMSIDTILPALRPMGRALAVADPNDVQLVVSMFVLGMVLGELVFGVLADAYGRKLTIQIGLGIFAIGCVVSVLAGSLEVVLVGRFIQGIGAAGPKIGSRALIRDRFEGAEMARVMSFIMMIFALTPMIAPALGQIIVAYGGWQSVFAVFLAAALVISLWMGLRQPETLPPKDRRPFVPQALVAATRECFSYRIFTLSTAVQALAFGMLFGCLSSTQQIFEVTYGRGDEFPFWFAIIALVSGTASILNARLVVRVGMQRMISAGFGLQIVFSLAVLFSGLTGGVPFALYLVWTTSLFFMAGLVIGNLNALAMEPTGHIAGLAASIIGATSTVLGVVIAAPIGLAFNGTPLPLASATAALSILSFTMVKRGLR